MSRSNLPHTPSRFTFGCMSLGSDLRQLDEHIRIARTAMQAGVWFHASPTYHRGFTFMVLRMAFDEARSQVPPMIIKIRCGSAPLLEFEVNDTLRRLGIERIELAQLVFTEDGPEPLIRDLTHDGPMADLCEELKLTGKVGRFAPQCSANTSQALHPLVEQDRFDGAVLYLNPMQRDADADLWRTLQSRDTPIYALRTLAGALAIPDRLQAQMLKHPEDHRIGLARRLQPLIEESGSRDWPELCMRYAFSLPHVRTTIGGTASPVHLERLLELAEQATPLPPETLHRIDTMRSESAAS
ncbi:MAG: aldo/keto reductase [Phycisphaeraceae bacterium]|nr:aldo/keto reductase [Phycisphaeraceae bacterium]